MNERIQELAEQASHQSPDGYPVTIPYSKDFVEKFAELIVQECIIECELVQAGARATTESEFVTDAGRVLHEGMWGGAKNCSGRIKEHFGVEE